MIILWYFDDFFFFFGDTRLLTRWLFFGDTHLWYFDGYFLVKFTYIGSARKLYLLQASAPKKSIHPMGPDMPGIF